MSKEQSKKTVFLDCPVCCSGNSFAFGQSYPELACEDCGFVLAQAPQLKPLDYRRCIFCDNKHFYFDSPFSLTFLGRSAVCYVCEAPYKGVRVNDPDQKYNEKVANNLQRSEAAVNLRERVERYNQRSGYKFNVREGETATCLPF